MVRGNFRIQVIHKEKTKYLEGQRNWKRCHRPDRMPHERNYEHCTQREQTQQKKKVGSASPDTCQPPCQGNRHKTNECTSKGRAAMGEPDAVTLKTPDGEMELAVISAARGEPVVAQGLEPRTNG